jgi:dTMP kinase
MASFRIARSFSICRRGLGLRAHRRRGVAGDVAPDRFEKEELDTHEKRREAFLDIAAREPERCHVVDALQTEEAIATEILAIVEQRLAPGNTLKMAEAAHE